MVSDTPPTTSLPSPARPAFPSRSLQSRALSVSDDRTCADVSVDCGGFVGKYVASALGNNTITEADIDARLEKLFRVRMRLSHFDPVGPLQTIGTDEICSQYSFDLSQDGPAQSSSLLKNDAKTLPLSASSAGTVAVIGPTSTLAESDSGYYGPHNVWYVHKQSSSCL